MQKHPADQVSVRKAQILNKNVFLPVSSAAGASKSDPFALCQYTAEEINCGEQIILSGGTGQLGQPLILIWSLTLAQGLLLFGTSRGEGLGDAGGDSWQ